MLNKYSFPQPSFQFISMQVEFNVDISIWMTGFLSDSETYTLSVSGPSHPPEPRCGVGEEKRGEVRRERMEIFGSQNCRGYLTHI